ncbi:MAG: PAS domain S-box protein [Pseudohaliea sp.]
MQAPARPETEAERLAALLDCRLLDTPDEECFDRLTRLARATFGTPIALISLVDAERQWFKSRQGLETREFPRDVSFCGHAILGDDIFQVPDASLDPRFQDNPLVTGEPRIRFYAGAPLATREGHRIGTLCLIDTAPRRLDDDGLARLRDLAACVETELELRRQELHSEALALLARIAAQETADTPRALREALKLACSYLDMPLGVISRGAGDDYQVQLHVSPPDMLREQQRCPLARTYCSLALAAKDVLAIGRVTGSEYEGHPCHETFGLESYIGVPISILDEPYGTLGFAAFEPRDPDVFSRSEREFVRLLGRWVARTLQRWQLDESLQQSEARLRRLFELSPVGIALNDFETGDVIEANDALINATGYTREEFFALRYRDLTPTYYAEEREEALKALETTGRYGPWEKEYIGKDGQPFPIVSKGVLLRDPSGRRLIWSIVEDVTDQRRAEEKLRASATFLESIVENMPAMIFLKHAADLSFALLNRAGEELLGRSRTELIGRSDFNFFPQQQAEFFSRQDRLVLESADVVDIPREPIETTAGTRILHTRKLALRDARGEPEYLLGISQDITERVQAEAALLAARDEAERANRAKSEFLSVMSHELRTPMNAIIGFGQLLDYDEGLSADHRENVREILKAGEHLLQLINEVLDLARVESGTVKLSLEPVAVGPLVEECLGLVVTLAEQRGIDVRLDDPGPVQVLADRTRLKQALLNLLSNAIKYNHEGGRVRVAVEAGAGEALRIVVADTGPGIAADKLDGLFRPFNRLDAEHSDIEGTGIGLALTRRIVELMAGTVGVESEPGVGSRFRIELPAASPAAASPGPSGDATTAAVPGPAQDSAQEQRRSVLYIEDNPANLRLMEQILARRGDVHLLTAHTPGLGIELAMAWEPQLILLDINLPGMDGYEVLKVLGAEERTRRIPVVAVTANAMPRDIERGRQAGFVDYLPKPLAIPQLNALLDRLLSRAAEP